MDEVQFQRGLAVRLSFFDSLKSPRLEFVNDGFVDALQHHDVLQREKDFEFVECALVIFHGIA